MDKKIGARIQAIRAANDLTQEQVAERIGVSRQKYARIENGSNTITLDLLQKIAGVFDVSVRDIVSVLDEDLSVSYRGGKDHTETRELFEMLDLFYANKHLYEKLQERRGD